MEESCDISINTGVLDGDFMDIVDGGSSKSYDMSKQKLCVIINNEEFHPQLNLQPRKGTENDFNYLKSVFNKLNYTTDSYTNVTSHNMYNILQRLSQRQDLVNVSAIVVIILSHGSDGIIYGVDGPVQLDRLFGYFKGDKCRGLIGKPKVFFIQACRGQKYDKGVLADGVHSSNIEKIPIEADFLIGYSTVPGYFSWRNGGIGSWYIQSLCQELEKYYKTHDLVQILVKVNNTVATNFRSHTKSFSTDGMVQISSFVCMLRKSLQIV